MTPDELRRDGDACQTELGREWYRAGAGLTDAPRFQAIYARYAHLVSAEAIAAARAAASPALLEWAVDRRIGRATADLDEQQQRWEQATTLELPDGTAVPYQRVPIELANTEDRDRRCAMEAARAARLPELAPLCRERFRRERAELAEVLGGDAVAARGTLAGIALDALADEGRGFLADTASLYEGVLGDLARRRLGLSVGDLARYDIARLFRWSELDGAFPAAQLLETARRQFLEIGLDPACGGRVRFDVEDRPGKSPRAFVSPARVPDEVYLVLRPRGGHTDYRTFWHELGHAMHFASVDRDRPFEARWAGDNSVTEGFAMLFDHLLLAPGWLRRYADLAPRAARSLVRELLVEELFFVRRYAAKLDYERDLYRADPDADLSERYAEGLAQATRFRYGPGDALVDVDPGFYAARYLRAWQVEAALSAWLTDRFDEDWYRNPQAGPFLADLFSRGQADPAAQLILQVTGRPLTFAAVRRRLEANLA